MKRIVYIHQYFKTPHEGGAIRSYYISKAMVNAGWTVDVVSMHNQNEYAFRLIDGIRVHYLPIQYANALGYFQRMLAFLKFLFKAFRLINKLPRPDLYYATSTPLSVGILALWLKKRHDIPYVFEVRDLWPEAPIQLGFLPFGIVQWICRKLEKNIYNHASHIIALSPGIQDGILKTCKHSNVAMIPNMSDNRFFRPNPSHEDTQITNIVYTGALGYVNDIKAILDIAEHCYNSLENIHFHIAGEGKYAKELKAEIRKRALTNIHFYGYVNKNSIRDMLNSADAAIVSFLQVPILNTNSPNKAFDAMASGVPMIFTNHNWLSQIALQENFGIYLDLKNPAISFQKFDQWIANREDLYKMGNRARKYAETHFDKDALCHQVLQVIDPSIGISPKNTNQSSDLQ